MSKKKDNEPKYLPSPLNNAMINYRVYKMSGKEKLIYSLLCMAAGGVTGLIFYGGLFKSRGEATMATNISNMIVFVLFGFVAMKIAMPSIRETLLQKRAKLLRKQFVDLLETLSTLLSSGSTVNDAFAKAEYDLQSHYQESDYIVTEVREINNGIANGKTIEEMIESFGLRSANKDIQSFGNVIGNCNRLGGDFRSVIRRTRDIIAEKIEIEEEIHTKLSSNKIQLNALSLMPIALVGLLKISSSSFAENLSSATGVIATTVAIAIFIGAHFWGKKIISIS